MRLVLVLKETMLHSRKNAIFYFLILVSTLIASFSIFQAGSRLQSFPLSRTESILSSEKEVSDNKIGLIPTPDIREIVFIAELEALFTRTFSLTITKTIFQIVIIMFFARLFGFYFRKLGQPSVLGEIIAGILLGPSFVGLLFPHFHAFLFTSDQVKILEILSKLGLILFVFVIGMDIDLSYLRRKADPVILISHCSVFLPFLLGLLISLFLYQEYSQEGTRFYEFATFVGISMSVTAYPLLQRLLYEKHLSRSGIGVIAIRSSAFVDIIGWILLGLTIAMVSSKNWIGLTITLSLAFVYSLLMAIVFQPFLKRMSEIYVSRENLTKTAIAIVLLFIFVSALFTELIGLNALIGAFFAGVIMPSSQRLKSLIAEKIDYIALVFLLPLFFTLTGIRTDLRIFQDEKAWAIFGGVLLLATLGKFLGAGIPAKILGFNWRDSINLGIFMNARGLVELIVLNIGYEAGIISTYLFTIFVLMSFVTTFLTSPLVQFVQTLSQKWNPPAKPLEAFKRILISFAQPSTGVTLLRLSNFLFGGNKDKMHISIMHITPTYILTQEELKEYKEKTFADIETLMQELDLNVEMIHRTTENITYEILNQAKISKARFLLIGAGKPLFSSNILGGRIRSILSYAPCNVGVLLDNGLERIEKVLILKRPTSGLGYEKLIHYLLREHGTKKIRVQQVPVFTTLKHDDFVGYHLVVIEIDLWKEREEFLEIEVRSLEVSFLIVTFK